ncbi:RING finger and SPRY domain-containing protein 1 [Linnemannia schmuckeri]|uniref:RING finger and SPRY domain-containing protein 1 n=1 Tax=Linnemannia schmuckeri TaxID=64567 RepID=A0A9P5VCL5_9FUNG|nr:RING finger and SPRY domain-containing protein 1 [Linnemannia schmuckeri]
MNRMAARLLERVFVKVHIRAAWNKLHNMTEQGELSSALESLIHLTATDSSYCELIGVMVDMITTDSLGIAAPFLCHIIDMAALPSQQTTRRMSQQLLSKCDPGGLARLRSKKKNKTAAALIWSMLANRLAGEMSAALFSDAVCECLLNNIENDSDMTCKVFSIIALEKFSLTGPCKARIMQTPIRRLLRDTANMSTFGLTDKEEIAGILQAKFCAEWSLRNIFRDITEEPNESSLEGLQPVDQSPSISQTENDMSARESLSPAEGGSKPVVGSRSSNVKVILNTLDATRHWKISEDGLTIRNDGSTFESIRATKSVTCGKWFYEVTLITAGIMQLGWATAHCQFSPEDGTGVGDDLFGFAYDGSRNLIWSSGESESYGDPETWRPGDILGFYLDVDNAVMECFVNGQSLGPITPFDRDRFSAQAISGYFPAFSFTSFQQATFNFGASEFKYPPALPWRNLNEQGTITSEMKEAIIRPRSESVYGRLKLDPVTGVRLASMPEEEDDVDYSLLCTICCDHTATVTLQPCGHDGLCVECAYSLDMCPLCRSRIYQRQMFSASETKDTSTAPAANGLLISGLSSDASDSSSAHTTLPGLSTSSITTSTWSTEYFGPSGAGHSREPVLTASGGAAHQHQHQHQHQDSVADAAAAAAAAAIAAMAASAQNSHSTSTGGVPSRSGSTESLSRRRNTLAATTPSSSRIALEQDCLNDPFSPPSTAYFAFLNRPSRLQRPSSHLHPMDMESVDPLELPGNSSRRASLQPQPFDPLPIHHHQQHHSHASSSDLGPLDAAPPLFSYPDELSLSAGNQTVPVVSEDDENEEEDNDDEDGDGLDVHLVDEGREATNCDVMDLSAAPDFPDAGSALHSRRSSIQVVSGGGSSALPPMMMNPVVMLPTALDFDRMGSISSTSSSGSMDAVGGLPPSLPPFPPVAGGTSRFGGRRASMPSNRLEM